ncbi:MAG: AAA family ATPase [Myxococcales bacterium]|nr:AAA family ATPase [Myxococcales bacterium]
MSPQAQDVARGLPDGLVEAFADPRTFSGGGSPITGIETHISHLALTEDRVYKLRKDVCFDFLDFSRREARVRDCLDEVRLNRRLAPGVYLGVAPAERREGSFRIGAPIEPSAFDRVASDSDCEWVVVMRRLSPGRDAESLLERGALTEPQIDALAHHLAAFHRAERLDARPEEEVPDPAAAVRENLSSLRKLIGGEGADRCKRLARRVRAFESLHGKRLRERLAEKRWVEGHGDLRLEHVWYEDRLHPEVIDCVEFSAALRQIDAANDVAFLAMDLRFRGAHALAERFLAQYASAADDFGIFSVLRYYEAYRAAVRAKVSALRQSQQAGGDASAASGGARAMAYLELAVRILDEGRRGLLIATTGCVGSGKSSLARELARRLPAVVISSDIVRKHLSGDAPESPEPAGWGTGRYRLEERTRIYGLLLERAEHVLRSGRHVILDASFAERAWRGGLASWAEERDFAPWLIRADCSDEVIHERLVERRRIGRSASDAGPELLAASRRAYEEPSEWPACRRRCIDTGVQNWRETAVAAVAADLRAAALAC